MSCWWSEYRHWYFQLMALTTPVTLDGPGMPRVYGDGPYEFYESEINGHLDELEEQLWAVRHRLA